MAKASQQQAFDGNFVVAQNLGLMQFTLSEPSTSVAQVDEGMLPQTEAGLPEYLQSFVLPTIEAAFAGLNQHLIRLFAPWARQTVEMHPDGRRRVVIHFLSELLNSGFGWQGPVRDVKHAFPAADQNAVLDMGIAWQVEDLSQGDAFWKIFDPNQEWRIQVSNRAAQIANPIAKKAFRICAFAQRFEEFLLAHPITREQLSVQIVRKPSL